MRSAPTPEVVGLPVAAATVGGDGACTPAAVAAALMQEMRSSPSGVVAVPFGNDRTPSMSPPRDRSPEPEERPKTQGMLLAGDGWRGVHTKHLNWQRSLGIALSRADPTTASKIGYLASLGVFDTLLDIHYMDLEEVDKLAAPVASLIRSYHASAERLVWGVPEIKAAILENAMQVVAKGEDEVGKRARLALEPTATELSAVPSAEA